MIDKKAFDRLSTLSKFDFSPEDESRFINDLNGIIGFIGKVKEFDGLYDDTAENNHLTFSELRQDTAKTAATPEQLLSNTVSENNCYVIPKVMN